MSSAFEIKDGNRIDIDLRENILLEASAGTGKTYSLERVVLNLIKNEKYKLSIKDILVVTFTKKATREMKERIRKILIDEFRKEKDPSLRHRLETAIGEFDEASIFTIHGFCQNTLQTFPFESLSLFNQEINQDSSILVGAVWDYLRGLEKSADDRTLEEFYSFRGGKSFSLVVEELIKIYGREEFKDCAAYFPETPDVELIYNEKSEFDGKLGTLYNLISIFKNYSSEMLYEASKAMACGTRKTTFEKIVSGFESIKDEERFYSFMAKLYDNGFCESLYKLHPKFLTFKSKKGLTPDDVDTTSREIILNTEQLFAHLEPLFDESNLKKNPVDRFLAGEFIKKALKGIDESFKKRQESQGALSYNDLINNLHERIMQTNDLSLLNALRDRYKVALIDEFQDTDKKQWDIFSKVFGETDTHNYFLIGDPKQSIYGFRGADLEIYYQARTSVNENNSYFLGTNFRSEKGIVQGVNSLFKKVFEVEAKGHTVPTEFQAVDDSSETKQKIEHRVINGTNEAIEFLVYDDDELEEGKLLGSKDCKHGYFDTVVNKIYKLLTDNDHLVKPGEIAILVESHNDSIILRDSLLKIGVPVVISKQKNVYKSDEADHILTFLKALNRPGGNGEIKALLLSPLFAFGQKEIHQMEDSGELEVISSQILLWSQRLIHSGIIAVWKELEAYSTKGHLQSRILSTINGERAYTNYKHLIEDLDRAQKSERLTTLTLLQRLNTLMESSEEDEENSVRLDRDSEAVQIMTIHASKGLEFPIVFFAGGLGKARADRGGYGKKYADKGGVWTMDFLSRGSSKILAERDEWEEKKRLYYVAFTRAKNKLYMPLFPRGELIVLSSLYASLNWDQNKIKIEEQAGDKLVLCEQPIHCQLKTEPTTAAKNIKTDLAGLLYEDVESHVSAYPEYFSIERELYKEDITGFYTVKQSSDSLTFKDLETKRGFRNRVTWVSSYSGLTKDSHGSVSKEDADREDDEEVVTPVFKKSDEINNFNIPGGATFGDLIHEFFEVVDFGSYNLTLDEFLTDEQIHEHFLSGAKKHFDLDWGKKYGDVSKEIVWNTLNCKLKMGDESIVLGEFGINRRIHEREFYFRVDRPNKFISHDLELLVEQGFLKGFIDLIINCNGCLYIADWKTTTIKGMEIWTDYSEEKVEKSMSEHNYHLQGLIYTVALYLHLQKSKKDFDYNKDIGGYFYFFVRGVHPDAGTGISFYKPTEDEVLSFIREFRGDL